MVCRTFINHTIIPIAYLLKNVKYLPIDYFYPEIMKIYLLFIGTLVSINSDLIKILNRKGFEQCPSRASGKGNAFFLRRDLKNLNRYFARLGVNVLPIEEVYQKVVTSDKS